MTQQELLFFNAMPDALVLYEALREKILSQLPNTTIQVQKTQIAFRARYLFAFVSLRRIKGCPKFFLLLSFGLSHRLSSPRIAICSEPYPNRWTHHMIIDSPKQLDAELMGWLSEAWQFAQTK